MCPFRSPAGEIHEVIVVLSADECADVMRHRREGRSAGFGPLPLGYAWHRAVQEAPPEFVPLFGLARCLTVH
jgi:hypothetical protein